MEKQLITDTIELLETLSNYPIARIYPDGPCLERDEHKQTVSLLERFIQLDKDE